MTLPVRFLLFLCSASLALAQVGSLQATFQLHPFGDRYVAYQNGMPVPAFEKQRRPTVSLAGTWKKLRFAANHTATLTLRDSAGLAAVAAEGAGCTSPWFNDAAWADKALPMIENNMVQYERMPEIYQNGVWYRTKFTLADSLKQKFAKLNFLAVNYVADVWLNGVYIGYHEGGYTSFSFDVTNALRYDSANVIVVRVDNVPWGTRKDIVPYVESDWFNYTGILHEPFLEFSDKVSVTRADAVPKNTAGLVDAFIVLNNRTKSDAPVDVTVKAYLAKNDSVSLRKEVSADLAGAEVALQGTTIQSVTIPAESIAVWTPSFTVSSPKLWSPRHPDLYILKVTVTQNGVVKDEFFTQFGIRTVKTLDDKLLLNEKVAFLHGVARHEDHPTYGRAIPVNEIFNDLWLVKGLNANYLRTGHYPNDPYTYLVADRLGLVVMEEIPVWWFDETFPWLVQNSVRMIHRQMFRETAFRDRNRPSIAMWSLANECLDVNGRSTFFGSMTIDAQSLYPDGRLFTQSAAADRPGPYDASQSYLDVAGWTMYFGIFYNPYAFGYYKGTRTFLLDAHDNYPKKPVIATEFGYWSGEEMNQFSAQVKTFDSTFAAFEKQAPILRDGRYNFQGFLAGVTWWTIFDWYRQSNGFQSMGLMRMDRKVEKPVATSLRNMYAQYKDKSEYITSVAEKSSANVPESYALLQNFPNPFNPSTTIGFQLPEKAFVTITVFDVLGKQVATVLQEEKEAGTYTVPFRAGTLASGLYLYRIQAGSFTAVRKMMLLK